MENSSPVFNAITNITSLFDLDDQTCVFSYKNEKHFEELWELLDAGRTQYEKLSKKLIIVWDGIPARDRQNDFVGTSKYLTPIDWAVGFSLSVLSSFNKLVIQCPDLSILIFDLNSHLYSDADSVKFVDQFSRRTMKNLPWVRIFSPREGKLNWNIDNLFNTIIGNTTNEDNLVPSMRSSDKDEAGLGLLQNMWASILTRPSSPGDHHALANLIGPLLLTKDNSSDIHVKALSRLMKAIGLLPDGKDDTALLSSDNPWIDWKDMPWKNILDRVMLSGEKLNCILVDDQHEQGWGRVLCMALGVPFNPTAGAIVGQNNNIMVKAFNSPEAILQKMEPPADKDQRFRFSIGGNKDIPEVLFLDLRLFSGVDISEEVTFFGKLIPLARKLIEKANNKLPWPGFNKDEIDLVEEWCLCKDKKREDDIYITALTFLPRILALTDLSLPIILFSSTGRRDIVEKLKPYGNIITAFDKPKFTVDIPFDIAEQTRGKFQEAVEKGIKILQGRQICKKVKHLEDIALESPHLVPDGTIIPRFKHVEIYIDETGRAGQKLFTLGGVVIAYPEYEDVFKLDEDLRLQEVYWYSSDSADTKHLSKRPNRQNKRFQGACANTDWNYKDAAETLLSLSGKRGCFVTAVCINDILDAYNNPHDRHFPLKDLSSDARYVRVLSMLIELILFEMIPAWINNSVTVSIFPGTRISPVEMDKRQTLAKSEKPLDYFGFRPAPTDIGKPQNYYTIGAESVVSYVSRVIDSRHDLPAHISVHHSRGVTLTYGVPSSTGKNSLMWDNIRVQNYFADIVIGNKDLFGKQFTVGFDANADADLYTLIEAQHELQNDNLPLAIELMSSCEQLKEKMHGHIANKIAGSLNMISGSDYTRICQSSNLTGDAGVSGAESEPGIKREIIIISKIKRIYGGGIKLLCNNEASNKITVSDWQTKKIGAIAFKLRTGDRLIATVVKENDSLYGRDIALADQT